MLSFDITDRNIRIIKGTEAKNKISISSAATLNVDEDIIVNGHVKDVPRLVILMNQKIKSSHMMDKEAVVSISSNMTIFKELVVRRVPKDSEQAKIIKAEMQQKVGIDDSYAISYTIVNGNAADDEVTVLATACPVEVIDSYKRVFQMLGIPLKSVMIGCNCITKVLLSDDKNKSRMPLLAVQIDNNFISLNIYENNQLSFSRFASIDPQDYDNSADYVYEAVNENIFRMLQFHKSRNGNAPIRNVVLYGDTREFTRITRDLEQMDINTSVIAAPRNVKGYQNLEFSMYANAIGAMFSRDKINEKINLLEFGGTASMINDRVKSDTTFWPIFAIVLAGTAAVLTFITLGFAIKNKKILDDIKSMRDWMNRPQTIADLQKRDDREKMRDEVKKYKDMASIAYDALRSVPDPTSENYKPLEDTIRTTIDQMKEEPDKEVEGVEYNMNDFSIWEKEDYDSLKSNVILSNLAYSDNTWKCKWTVYAGKKPVPTFPYKYIQNLKKSDQYCSVSYMGDTVDKMEWISKPYDQFPGDIMDRDFPEKLRTVSFNVESQVKSPVDSSDMASFGDSNKGTNEGGEQ